MKIKSRLRVNVISYLAKSGVWDAKSYCVPALIGIPLTVEGIKLANNIYENPGHFKESITHAIDRIAKNIFTTLSCLCLMAAVATLSIYLLPAAMGISTAISAIYLIGKLFLNADTYKKQIIESFTVRPDEDLTAAKKRIQINALKTVALAIGLAGALTIGAYIVVPLLQKFTWSIKLPYQTKLIVFLEYAALSILHAGIAISNYLNNDKAKALFHLTAAVAAIAFPLFYWNNEMRLHHSFYGLALMALPSRTAKIIGSAIVLDSALYTLEPLRGGFNSANKFVSHDLINTIVDDFSLFYSGATAATIAENINNNT